MGSISPDLVAIVSPGTKGEVTLLAVKGEVGDVHHAGAFGDGRSIPGYLPIVAQPHVGVHGPREIIISSRGGKQVETNWQVMCVIWLNSGQIQCLLLLIASIYNLTSSL